MPQPFVFGINYHLTNAQNRGKFVLDSEEVDLFYNLIKKSESTFCFLIQTCNRTEIIGYGDMDVAQKIYRKLISRSVSILENSFSKTGNEAIIHLFRLASGLESQIIGDLEILGQVKKAFKVAKENKAVNGYIERWINYSIRCSKEIRSKTKLSKGTVTVAYATIQFIKKQKENENTKILVIGTGDFGKKIAKNIIDYLPNATLTLCNRTNSKAIQLSKKISCFFTPFENLENAVLTNQIIIAAIGNYSGFILHSFPEINEEYSSKIFIDLSIPFVFNPNLVNLGHQLVNVDDISKITQSTMILRNHEVPKALPIINHHYQEFLNWEGIFIHSNSIQKWKNYLANHWNICPFCSKKNQFDSINKEFTSEFVKYLKEKKPISELKIEIFRDFMEVQSFFFPCEDLLQFPQII